jgi:hypothetical protein
MNPWEMQVERSSGCAFVAAVADAVAQSGPNAYVLNEIVCDVQILPQAGCAVGVDATLELAPSGRMLAEGVASTSDSREPSIGAALHATATIPQTVMAIPCFIGISPSEAACADFEVGTARMFARVKPVVGGKLARVP